MSVASNNKKFKKDLVTFNSDGIPQVHLLTFDFEHDYNLRLLTIEYYTGGCGEPDFEVNTLTPHILKGLNEQAKIAADQSLEEFDYGWFGIVALKSVENLFQQIKEIQEIIQDSDLPAEKIKLKDAHLFHAIL